MRGSHGAYGLRLDGVDAAADLLVRAEPEWPLYELGSRVGEPARDHNHVDDDVADFVTRTGVGVRIERDPGRAVFTLPRRTSAHELVHPLLAHVAAIVAWWLGRESLHAGAFATPDGVWAVLGRRGSGKSSTLAWLARDGLTIVCDDMLVLDGSRVFAGPRSLDLRGDTARRLDVGEPLGTIGDRERWRLRLDPIGELPPLRGLFLLGWGDETSSRLLAPTARLEGVATSRGVNLLPADPGAMLRLAALPAYRVTRPRGLERLAETADELRRLAAV